VLITAALWKPLLKPYSDKWLDHVLGKRLEGFKADQQREIERLKHLLTSRVSRIHEKEFEVLPRAWAMLHEAAGWVLVAVGGTFRPIPALNKLSDQDLDEFLKVSILYESQRRALYAAANREEYFMDATAEVAADKAQESLRLFSNYIIQNRIFMTEELRNKFTEISGELNSALMEFSLGKRFGDPKMAIGATIKVSHKELQAKIDHIEAAVQKRLRFEEAG